MMNEELYKQAFIKTFSLTGEPDGLQVNSISEWDSVGHMLLIEEIETTFNILLDAEDIIGLTSYEQGKKIITNILQRVPST